MLGLNIIICEGERERGGETGGIRHVCRHTHLPRSSVCMSNEGLTNVPVTIRPARPALHANLDIVSTPKPLNNTVATLRKLSKTKIIFLEC